MQLQVMSTEMKPEGERVPEEKAEVRSLKRPQEERGIKRPRRPDPDLLEWRWELL